MCIRDSSKTPDTENFGLALGDFFNTSSGKFFADLNEHVYGCLLYTSDAADERSSVDLGGRRIIKKKKRRDDTVRRSRR